MNRGVSLNSDPKGNWVHVAGSSYAHVTNDPPDLKPRFDPSDLIEFSRYSSYFHVFPKNRTFFVFQMRALFWAQVCPILGHAAVQVDSV